MVLAVDIGGTYIKYGYVYGNTVEGANKFRTEFSFSKLCEKIDVLVNDNTERIAISSGGFWDNNGESIGYETIVEMRENNLVEYLKNKHNVPVTILNDARCALLCEKEYGALKGKENAVVFVLGSSVGCAVMINGKLYRGNHKKAGMFFKMPENLYPYIYEESANTVKLANKFWNGNADGKTIKEIGELSEKGDEKSLEYIKNYSDAIALKLFYSKLMYDPEIIAIGGGISKNDYLTENILKSYRQLLKECGENDDIPVAKTTFGEHSNLIGAVLYGLNSE